MEQKIYEKLNSFFSAYPLQNFKKGSVIHHPGSKIDKVAFVKTGYIKLYKIDNTGSEVTIDILKPGLYFTLIFALNNTNNNYFFEAVTEVELWEAPKAEVFEYLKNNTDVMFEIFNNVSAGFLELMHNYEVLSSGKAYNKVAGLILRLAERSTLRSDGNKITLNYKPSHQVISDMLGLSRETVSIELKKLSNDGVIDYDSTLLSVEDLTRLRNIVYGE